MKRIINVMIKIFYNKIKPKSQFINEKQIKIQLKKMKKKLIKDRLTYEFQLA